MDKKYYWYSYVQDIGQIADFNSGVSSAHPFTLFKLGSGHFLLNWREITEEDYNLFKKMENE